MPPIACADALETILPDEGATIQGIIATMEGEARLSPTVTAGPSVPCTPGARHPALRRHPGALAGG